jgi:chromosome partitioning protein
MVDLRANLSRQVMDEVRAHFGPRVYDTPVPRNVRLSEAPSHGKPVLLYDIRSRGAASYLALAEEFLKRRGPDAAPSRPLPPTLEAPPDVAAT